MENIKIKLMLDKKNCKGNLEINQIHGIYANSTQEIRSGIEPFGYFKTHTYSRLVRVKEEWLASFNIVLGPAIKIDKLEIKVTGPGRDNSRINKLINHFPLKTGDDFNTFTYTNAKNKLQSRASNQGYIQNYLKNSVILNLLAYKAVVKFWLETGKQFYFGSVSYVTHIYADNFLRRIILFKPSEPYSPKKILTLQREMEASYYFKRVSITPDYEHIENYHVPLKIAYEVPKAYAYRLGIGYGTLTGARLSAALSLRRLSDTGNHFEAEMQLSSIQSKINGTYYIPGKNPLTDQWLIGMQGKVFDPNNGKSQSVTSFGGYSTKQDNFQYTAKLNFIIEHFRITNESSQTSHELFPNLNIAYLKTNDLVNPENAINFVFNVQGAEQTLLATNSFIQPEIQTKFIVSPFSFARFIFRGDVGAVFVKDVKSFPLSLRYFAGGIQSIRGFADSSIGPGRYLAVASSEYQQKIIGNWNAAVFYDLGNATDNLHDPLNRGTGVGVVYHSLVGSIKVYLARAISKHTQPWSVEFSIGPEFS